MNMREYATLHLDTNWSRGCRGPDRMVVGFTTTYANQGLSPLML